MCWALSFGWGLTMGMEPGWAWPKSLWNTPSGAVLLGPSPWEDSSLVVGEEQSGRDRGSSPKCEKKKRLTKKVHILSHSGLVLGMVWTTQQLWRYPLLWDPWWSYFSQWLTHGLGDAVPFQGPVWSWVFSQCIWGPLLSLPGPKSCLGGLIRVMLCGV